LVTYCRETAEKKVRRFQDQVYWGRPVPSFGDPQARMLIIGLAPAAHGANRTGRAFTGDRSGAWLYQALHTYGFASQPTSDHRQDGLELLDCYIAQVLHCAPPGNTPTHQEIANCQEYLVHEMRLLSNVRVVIPLGKLAFDAFLRVAKALAYPLPSPLPRFGHAQRYAITPELTLVTSYHPSQQNTQTGRLTRAMFHEVFVMARTVLATSS
jgi:uracil-DNA glycosylase family 4